MKQQNSLSRKTLFNHAFVFRSDTETMEKIRSYLLECAANLIYQKHSLARLFIIEEGGSGSHEATNNHQ